MMSAFLEAHGHHGKRLRRYGRARKNPVSGTTIAVVSLGALAAAALGFAIYEKTAAAKTSTGGGTSGPPKSTQLSAINTGGNDVAKVGDLFVVQLVGVNQAGSPLTWTDHTAGSAVKFLSSEQRIINNVSYVFFTYECVATGQGQISITPNFLATALQPFTYNVTVQ